ARSDPATGRIVDSVSRRRYRRGAPSPFATNTTDWPSGETATPTGTNVSPDSESGMLSRALGAAGAPRNREAINHGRTAPAPSKSAATANRSRRRDPVSAVRGTTSDDRVKRPPSRI